MTKPIHPAVLFRISVIGPLMSRADLAKGELKILVCYVSINLRGIVPTYFR